MSLFAACIWADLGALALKAFFPLSLVSLTLCLPFMFSPSQVNNAALTSRFLLFHFSPCWITSAYQSRSLVTPVAFGQPVEATHSLRLKPGGDLELGVLLCAWGLNPHPASSACHELPLYHWYLQRALLGGILLRYRNTLNIDVFLISPTAAGIKITFCTSSRLKAHA